MQNTLNNINRNYKIQRLDKGNLDLFMMNTNKETVVKTYTNDIIGKLDNLAAQISKPEFLKRVGPLEWNKISSLVNEAKYDARRLRNASYVR